MLKKKMIIVIIEMEFVIYVIMDIILIHQIKIVFYLKIIKIQTVK